MALTWGAKPPTAVMRYVWRPAVLGDDDLASHSLTVSSGGITVLESEIIGDEVAAFISGGTAGTTAVIAATAVTGNGEELVETIYLPIVTSAVTIGDTARDICTFALRKLVGNGVTPTASEMDDALERLNLMLSGWKYEGADIGAAFPLDANSVIYCPDYAVEGIKYNLIQQIAPLYSYELSEAEVVHARRGLQRIKQNMLPEERGSAEYI